MASKRFITSAPRQRIQRPDSGEIIPYEAVDNDKLYHPESGSYPVMNLLHAYVEAGDQVEILVITADYDFCHENYRIIEQEALALCQEKRATSVQVTKIPVEFSEHSENHLDIFRKLIAHIQENDRLYACITYGSKPTPLLQIMALNYGYRTFKNVCIEAIVYGEMDHKSGRKRIFDVTALFLMDQIINELSQHKHHNVLSVIENLLSDTEDFDEGE